MGAHDDRHHVSARTNFKLIVALAPQPTDAAAAADAAAAVAAASILLYVRLR